MYITDIQMQARNLNERKIKFDTPYNLSSLITVLILKEKSLNFVIQMILTRLDREIANRERSLDKKLSARKL